MKKIIIALLMVLVCGALSACTTGGEKHKSGDEEKISVATGVSADCFEWSPMFDTQIVGYTKEGLNQTKLTIPGKCTSVQGLRENKKTETIIFENPDTEILESAFAECTGLISIQLPDNLEIINNYTFVDCTNLKSIKIPDSVTLIKSDAFMDCAGLEEVSFGKNLQIIGRQAFCECVALQSVKLPDSVTTIEKSAFEKCASLKEVTLSVNLERIGASAFRECNELVSIRIPEGVTTLDDWAFAYCDSLEEIYLPASLQSIEISSIVQTHNIDVYVVQGSYIDEQLDSLMGVEFYNKKYQ